MKKNLKKIFVLSLSLALAITFIPAQADTAYADEIRISNAAQLDKVTSLKARDRDNDEIELAWTPVEGASGYEAARYSVKDGKWITLGVSDDNDYDVENLLSATVYSFRVRAFAVNAQGEKTYGSWSKTYKTCTRPDEVKQLQASAKTQNTITLKWNSVKRADGYQVYIWDSASGQWDRLINTSKTSYKVTDLKKGTSYKFQIRPYRNAVDSRYYGEYEDITVKTSSGSSSSASDVIGKSRAKNIALADAGVSSSAADFIRVELDRDDGVRVYEIEFTAGDKEYEYEIHAVTGKIRDKDVDSIWD